MTIEIDEFWNLLAASHLLPVPQLPAISAEFAGNRLQPTSAALAGWLVKQGTLTEYQAQILLAGHSGPFKYGNYIVSDSFSKGNNTAQFKAHHESTQHPVLLEFFAGHSANDLNRWQHIEATVEQFSQISAPHLLSTYESVVMPHFRFVAGQRPAGVMLSTRLPTKSRMPWRQACLIFSQVAAGLEQLHRQSLAHGAVSPRTIWIAKNGLSQLRLSLQTDPDFESADPAIKRSESRHDYLAPEWNSAAQANPAMDVYSFGRTFERTVTGRLSNDVPAIIDFKKFEIPSDLESLICGMLTPDPGQRRLDLGAVSKKLESLAGKSTREFVPKMPSSLVAYRHALDQFKPGRDKAIVSVPPIATEFGDESDLYIADRNATNNRTTGTARVTVKRKKKNRWMMPATVASALLLFSSAIGWWAWQTSKRVLPVNPVSLVDPKIKNGSGPADTPSESEILDPTEQRWRDIAALPSTERPIVLQNLIADDRETLWESPTTGPPVDLVGLPAAPKLIFIFRLAELTADAEGNRLIQSLGPEFRSLVDQLPARCGVDLAEIEQLIISLHTTADFDYEPFFIVSTREPIDIDLALQAWNHPTAAETESGQRYYVTEESNQGFYLLANDKFAATGMAPDSISRFAFGSRLLTAEVANNGGKSVLAGAMVSIADWTDRDRHVNLLFLRTALFNDEGQKLMGAQLRKFNRELSILIPDTVRGGVASLHLDNGTYLELILDRTVDREAGDLKAELSKQFRQQRDRLTRFVATIPRSPYWDNVRLKYDNMLTDLFRNLRWGVEHQKVIANAWLPPMAAHNLLAASELVVSFSGGASVVSSVTTASAGPQNIAELLAAKRDLNVANPPDLNLLMSDIEAAVNDDHPGLRFKFRIRLLGSDLQADGITKNQRPSELNLQQQSLADILTQIMTAANPSKDITGPADPACKLVWVVADDPENPGQPAVLITTRTAAAKKSYELPPAFQEK